MPILNIYQLPILLTMIRLTVAPLLLPMLLVKGLPHQSLIINVLLTLLFIAFSFTDFLDGYYARKLGQTSLLGGALDHIADKFLVYSTCIALLAVGKIFYFWVIIFIGRDFFVMGLRLIALQNQFSLPVDYVGKIKTACVMLLLAWLILNPYQGYDQASIWQRIELSLMIASLTLTLISGYHYYRSFMQQLRQQNRPLLSDNA